ncbi:MAG TPA: alpha-glucan family phosphorylase [Gammaproteobacteria bacterium]|jgi:starch phosphorylase
MSTVHSIQVVPRIPAAIGRLDELVANFWFSWSPRLRELLARLDPELWLGVEANPRRFLRCVHQEVLDAAAQDEVFLRKYRGLLAEFEIHLQRPAAPYLDAGLAEDDLVAYFSAEYGLHESFPIYSGGLGILAGDHCKTASDLNLRFVAIGLLYRQGYFRQRIDRHGQQLPEYPPINPTDMPIKAARTPDGAEAAIECPFPDRVVHAKVWQVDVGRIPMLLLDTDIDRNSAADRTVTNVLYGGDRELRLEQEVILGIGGVRALRAVGLQPTVWHLNEGHAAFSLLERMRELVDGGLPYAAAREAVATSTVFTTHTPVAAGHDVFPADMVVRHFAAYITNFGISAEDLLAFGNGGTVGHEFNMTKLALHASASINGVSRIHGRVSAQTFRGNWPEIDPLENPVGYVTNGVHVPTFMRQTWSELLDQHLGAGWYSKVMDEGLMQKIVDIPDDVFWHTNQKSKRQMLGALHNRLSRQWTRNQVSEAHTHRLLRYIDPDNPDVLTIGFARRFATYKRSTLLFSDLAWLESLVKNEERPIVFVFAGKAHPADDPGQQMIREIHRVSSLKPFIGRIVLVEGYDMGVGRLLTSGVDVWLNTPIHPFEASGTSGMKAAINGTVNLSVLDGWWAEGYDGENGWGIPPSLEDDGSGERDRQDATTLYEILQDEVVPLYYARDAKLGYSPRWVAICKRAMASALPRFNSRRVVHDYVRNYYGPAAARGRTVAANDFAVARELATWKAKVRAAWSGVELRSRSGAPNQAEFGRPIVLEIDVKLNGLSATDVRLECVLSRQVCSGIERPKKQFSDARHAHEGIAQIGDDTVMIAVFKPGSVDGDYQRYRLEMQPPWAGAMFYSIRAVPYHTALAHPYEIGLMRWL